MTNKSSWLFSATMLEREALESWAPMSMILMEDKNGTALIIAVVDTIGKKISSALNFYLLHQPQGPQMNTSKKVFLSCLCTLSIFTYAAEHENFKRIKDACENDVKSYCADVEKGEGRIHKCLKENKEKLSSGCSDTLKEVKDKFKEKKHEIMESCKSELEEFCKDKKRKEAYKCLRNQKTVSETCKQALESK
jgi:gas vesicle protein